MRIVVIGTSGAGKTTLARRIASRLALPHIELDAINWQPGWRDLTRHDPEEFVGRVTEAIRAEAWVADGNYGLVRERLWQRATHLVWLDYERPVIMARVIFRTFLRAVLRTELWAGNRERWRHMLRPSHPIRWAWSTWERRRRETLDRLAQPQCAHLTVIRLHHPGEARGVVELLAEKAGVQARCVGAAPASGSALGGPEAIGLSNGQRDIISATSRSAVTAARGDPGNG
ncbi:MAG: adenylate kinase [Alphaproteobacteria bacterium]|nr:adenylate kinase [Alphaproteobacteria bacterium]